MPNFKYACTCIRIILYLLASLPPGPFTLLFCLPASDLLNIQVQSPSALSSLHNMGQNARVNNTHIMQEFIIICILRAAGMRTCLRMHRGVTDIMKGTKVQTLGARAVAGAWCMAGRLMAI